MQKKPAKKIINCRVPLVLAASLAAGVALGVLVGYLQQDPTVTLIILPICAAVTLLLLLLRRGFFVITVFLLSAVFLLFGVFYGYQKLQSYAVNEAPAQTCTVTGTVKKVNIFDEGRRTVLTDVTCNGQPLDADLQVNIYATVLQAFDEGDTLSFDTTLEQMPTFAYGRLNTQIINDVKYRCSVQSPIQIQNGFSLFGSVRSSMRNNLYQHLDSSTAGVAFAMLTGDTDGMEEGVASAFNYGGTAHVFAVSGMNIALIYGVLRTLCRLLRLRGPIPVAVSLAATVIYTGICGFAVSPMRALIMCIVAVVCKYIRQKYDMLNSLSLSVVIILLINPLDLFSAGFQLSVLSVLGIALFNVRLQKRLQLPAGLNEGLSIMLSAQTGTLPAMFGCFGYVSAVGLLMNYAVLPLLSAAYVCIFAGVLLAMIIPPASGFFVGVTAAPLDALLSFLVTEGLEKGVIYGLGGALFLPLFYLFAFLLSDKIKQGKRGFAGISVAAAIAAAGYAVVTSFYPFNGTYMAVSAYYGGGYVLMKSKGENVLIITEDTLPYRLDTFLASGGGHDLSATVLLGDSTCVNYYYNHLSLDCDTVYVCQDYMPVDPQGGAQIIYQNQFTVGDIAFAFDGGYAVRAQTDGVTVGICAQDRALYGCDMLIGDLSKSNTKTVNFNGGGGEWCVYQDGGVDYLLSNGKIERSYLF